MSKYFTIDEAKRSLAFVKPIVHDILAKLQNAQILHDEVKNLKTSAAADELTLMEKLTQVEKLLNQIEYHMAELSKTGATMKDLAAGAVDFPCLYEGRLIQLCWKFGEETVMFWHESSESLKDRKPVTQEFIQKTGAAIA